MEQDERVRASGTGSPISGTETVHMFLNGTAMAGQADHRHIAGSRFLGERRTAPLYRFYAVRDEFPGLVPAEEGGASILGELYEIAVPVWRDQLLPNEPSELTPGRVELDDGTTAHVMLLDLSRVRKGDKLVDISELGGWRTYLRQFDGGRERP